MSNEEFIEKFDALSDRERYLFQQLFYSNHQSVAEKGLEKRQLVAYLSGDNIDQHYIKNQLQNKLPNHMVPKHIVVLKFLPKLPNGKIDVSRLIPESPKTTQQNLETETFDTNALKLKEIWQEVLQVDTIGFQDNFFEFGGDSILAIQIVSKARNSGIELSPSIFLEKQTISEIVSSINNTRPSYQEKESSKLLPIQMWFFDTLGNNPHWHLGLKIELSSQAIPYIKEGLQYLLIQNPALNSGFIIGEQETMMVHQPDANFVIHDIYSESTDPDNELLHDALIQLHGKMDLQRAILVGALLVNGSNPKLFLSFHHLVVDPLSVVLLYQELGRIISTLQRGQIPDKPPKQSIHFYQVAELINSIDYSGELDFWQQQCASFKPLFDTPNKTFRQKNTARTSQHCGETLSNAIINGKKRFAWLQPDVLFTTAIIQAITNWLKRSEIVVGIESSARKLKDVEAFETIGWMTTYYPLCIQVNSDNPESTYFNVQEKFEKVQHKGCGYGVLRYKQKIKSLAIEPEVLINYIGSITAVTNSTLGRAAFHGSCLRSEESLYNLLLEFNILQQESDFEISCTYISAIINDSVVENILNDTIGILNHLLGNDGNMLNNEKQAKTMKSIGIDESDLNEIMNQL